MAIKVLSLLRLKLLMLVCCYSGITAATSGDTPILEDIQSQSKTLISGSRVYLKIPEGYTQNNNLVGIQHHKYHSAVIISEVQSPYLDFIRQYEDEKLAQGDMTVLSRRHVELDGLSGQRIIGEYEARGKKYIRQILITGDTKESVIIAGFYPKSLRKELAAHVIHTINTSLWDSSRILNLFEGLGYRIDDVPGLRLATRINDSLVFTENGRLPDQYYTEALLILTLKVVPSEMDLRTDFAADQFKKITLIENHQIENISTKPVIGFESVAVEGGGTHRHLGYNVATLQLMINTELGFLVAQGFSTRDEQEHNFDMFRTTVSSFRIEP